MSPAAAPSRQLYQLHGIELEIVAHEVAVLDALALRLRAFASRRADPPPASIRIEFVTDEPALPSGPSRPVYDTPDGSLHYFPDADVLSGAFRGVTLVCDAERGRATLHAEAFTGRHLYLATHPLTTICLMEMLERRGRFSLHAGCLAAGDGRGVLVAGPSGSGKSTLTLALVQAGLSLLADDVVFLDVVDGGKAPVRALGFSDAIGITEATAARFPELGASRAGPPPDGFPKRLGRVEDLLGISALHACTPRVLVFPHVAPELPSRIDPLPAADALVRLVPDVLLTQPAATQAHLEAIGALLDQVRCFELRSGRDLARAAELVREQLLGP